MPPDDPDRWRERQRDRLRAERLALPRAERRTMDRAILRVLDEAIGPPAGLTISLYWPYRGEPDLRPLMERIVEGGGRLALPVVVERGRPLEFRRWTPGGPLEDGVWGIPVPPAGAEVVVPDVIVVPVVGFDAACYRLGHGGGYYDRTLAALPERPRFIGVGYALAELPTIRPRPHDVPLDMVVTERGVTTREAPPPPSPGDTRP